MNTLYFLRLVEKIPTRQKETLVVLLTADNENDAKTRVWDNISPEYWDKYWVDCCDPVCQTPDEVDCYEPV